MTAPRFLVLRDWSGKLQPLGPMAEPVANFEDADAEARRLCLSNTGVLYVVAQVIAEYTQEPNVTVNRLEPASVAEIKRTT